MSTLYFCYPELIEQYSYAIYKYGHKSFQNILPQYVKEVFIYVSKHFTLEEIDLAYINNWINIWEYRNTLDHMNMI